MNWLEVANDRNGVKSSDKDACALKRALSVSNTAGTDDDADANGTNIKVIFEDRALYEICINEVN